MESVINPSLPRWSPLGRLAFRIAFLYFLSFLFFNDFGNIFTIIPVVGDGINTALTWPMRELAAWTGRHIFHLTGIAATWHDTGSGDTALCWILNGLFVLFAIAGGLLWTGVASRHAEYQTLYAWLRFLLRLTLGYIMLRYGLVKLYAMQMAPISIAVLNEPVGDTSPMTFLWSLIGLNPAYQSICGVVELLGGVLLLFRRTALSGALLTAFAMSNVVLFNFFFDVPVKLLSLSLLFAAIFLVLPDGRALVDFFWRRRPATPAGIWFPPVVRRSIRIAVRTVEIVFTVAFLILPPISYGISWRNTRAEVRTPSPLLGAWRLETVPPATGPFVTAGGNPAIDFYVDTVARAFTRSTDGALWRTFLQLDPAAHTVSVGSWGRPRVTYSWAMLDANHLTLTSIQSEKPAILAFTRIPIPSRHPLLTQGFHLVHEWNPER